MVTLTTYKIVLSIENLGTIDYLGAQEYGINCLSNQWYITNHLSVSVHPPVSNLVV